MFIKRLIIISVVILLFLSACELKTPAAPKWETEFTIPLLNATYPIINLVDGENIAITDTGELYFYMEGELEAAEIKRENLTMPPLYEDDIDIEWISLLVHYIPERSIPLRPNDTDDTTYDKVLPVSGVISEGGIDFRFHNMSAEIEYVTLIFRELYFENEPKEITVYRSQNGTFPDYHNSSLAGYEIRDEQTDAILDSLHFSIRVFPEDIPPYLLYGSEMKVFFNDRMYFSEVRGILDRFEITTRDNSTPIEINYPVNIENMIGLNAVNLSFDITSHVGFETEFQAEVFSRNTRSGAVSETLEMQRTILSVLPGNTTRLTHLEIPDPTDPKYDEEMAKVVGLLNIAPDVIEVKDIRYYISNPEGIVGFAKVGTTFEGVYNARVPFDFHFYEGEYLQPDTLTVIELSDNNRAEIKKRARHITMNVELSNHFEVGAAVQIFLSSTNDTTYVFQIGDDFGGERERLTFPKDASDEIALLSGTLNNPSVANLVFDIPNEHLSIFYEHPTIYMGMRIFLKEGDGYINSLAYIGVVADLKVRLYIDLED